MSIISTTIMAFSMSADAFAAAVSKGVSMPKPQLRKAMNIASVFAAVETITPIIGWLAGMAANSFVADYDHWVAFIILAIVGGKMFLEGLTRHEDAPKKDHTLSALILTAIGTSIDAMAVGATLAFMDASIWISALAIGAATFLMATMGIMTGHYIGTKGGKIAEILGGLGLIAIGTKILLEHLGVLTLGF